MGGPCPTGGFLSVEGFVVDIACLRRYLPQEYLERARAHTSDCALMGHCVESGCGLVGEDGELRLLDTHPTTMVVERLAEGDGGRGSSCGRTGKTGTARW